MIFNKTEKKQCHVQQLILQTNKNIKEKNQLSEAEMMMMPTISMETTDMILVNSNTRLRKMITKISTDTVE